MPKNEFKVELIDRRDCTDLLRDHHYLSKIQRGFKTGKNYGLLHGGEVVGVCIFTGLPVPEIAKGCFGLNRDEQDGLYELSRLCLSPEVQEKEHNITSWFTARCIKHLKRDYPVKAILSYADVDFHSGTVYKALGFDYYGLSDPKKDFWIKQPDGTYKKHSRGKTKGVEGEWRDRSRKHRFLKVFDKKLTVKWERTPIIQRGLKVDSNYVTNKTVMEKRERE